MFFGSTSSSLRSRSSHGGLAKNAKPFSACPAGKHTETIPVERALGRVLGSDALAPTPIPPWPHAKVAGNAIRSSDTLLATPLQPWLPTKQKRPPDTLHDADPQALVLAKDCYMQVNIGDPLPAGADAVLPSYDARLSHWYTDLYTVKVKRPIPPDWYVATTGADHAIGSVLVSGGTRLTWRQLAVLMQAGVKEVTVCRQPRIGLVSVVGSRTASSVLPDWQGFKQALCLWLVQQGYDQPTVHELPLQLADGWPQHQAFGEAYWELEQAHDLLILLQTPDMNCEPARGSGRSDHQSLDPYQAWLGSSRARTPSYSEHIPLVRPDGSNRGHETYHFEDHCVTLSLKAYQASAMLVVALMLRHVLDAMERATLHGHDQAQYRLAIPVQRPKGMRESNLQTICLIGGVLKERKDGEKLLFPISKDIPTALSPAAEANVIIELPIGVFALPAGQELNVIPLHDGALPRLTAADEAIIEAAQAEWLAAQAREAAKAALPVLAIDAAWSRLETYLAQEDPDALASLQPPASEEQVAALEAELGVSLPSALRATLLRHDGQEDIDHLYDGERFLGCAGIRGEWRNWKALSLDEDLITCKGAPGPGVKDDWFNLKWIPFSHDGMGDHLCVDMDPAEGGIVGQVIRVWHDLDDRDVIAPSFEAWFSRLVRERMGEGIEF